MEGECSVKCVAKGSAEPKSLRTTGLEGYHLTNLFGHYPRVLLP
jgi:hypothetical protein